MTNQQEEQIRSLRAQGVGYRNIAKVVNLSRDSVRNYCKRNNIAGPASVVKINMEIMMEDKTVCTYCGKPLNQNHTGRPKRFCSNRCRLKWWGQNRDKLKISQYAIYTFTCKHCGKEFKAYGNKKRIYCSHKCYIDDRFYYDVEEERYKPIKAKKGVIINKTDEYEVRKLS